MAEVAFIGFGEAARTFVKAWKAIDQLPDVISAYDIKTETVEKKQMLQDYQSFGVEGFGNLETSLRGKHLVFSLVTADQAVVAAKNAAPFLEEGSLYLDCNSCAPLSKKTAAGYIEGAGARYVDVAIMAPVNIDFARAPMLLSGEEAGTAACSLTAMGMTATAISNSVGGASTVKMMRSVMVKGLEALALECILSARTAGVDDAVVSSLVDSDPEFDWNSRLSHMLGRSIKHGVRRAAEMQEAAATVRELGVDNSMSRSIAQWQQTVGELELEESAEQGYQALADSILQELNIGRIE